MKPSALLLASIAAFSAGLLGSACKPKDPPDSRDTPATSTSVSSAPEKVPPASPLNATPVAQFADAGNIDGQPPFEQARFYEANGQLWMARLVLERKALGSDATTDETELLAKVCMQQNDESCVEQCGKKLGRKIKFTATAPKDTGPPAASASVGSEHKEPETDLSRARDLVLKNDYENARKTLEPKVLDGKASREEVRMLKTICQKQSDRMCMALCDAKLK